MKKLILNLFLIATLLSLALPVKLLAQIDYTNTNQQDRAFSNAAGLQSTDKLALSTYIAKVIRVALSLLGLIFIILIIYAGFLWMTAAGSEDRIEKSKKIMTAAIIGLIIVLAAYTITSFVLSKLISATGAGGSGETNAAVN